MMKKVLVGVLAVLLLAECALAEGGLSISFGIPFGDRRRRHHCDQSCDRHRQDPYVGVRYRSGTSIRRRTPSHRPGLSIGYSQWWGRDRQDPYVGLRYRSGTSMRRIPSHGPGLSIGYSQSWGRDRQVVREGREARQSIRDLIDDLRFGSRSERERAAKELGRLPVDDVVGALTEALLRDPDKNVRKEAARSLGKLGAEEARPALRHAARSDTSKRVRKAAEEALDQLRPPLPPLVRREYRYPEPDYDRFDREYRQPYDKLDRLLRELRSGDEDDREEAAKKLGKLEDRRAVPALVDVLRRDPEEDVREKAAEALGRIGDRSALPALRWAERHDREDDVREEAEEAIEKITD